MILYVVVGMNSNKPFEINGDAMMWSVQYKVEIEKKTGIPIDMQRLLFAGTELIRPHSGLQKESTIRVAIRTTQIFSDPPDIFENISITPNIEQDLNRLRNQNIYKWEKVNDSTVEFSFHSKLDIYAGKIFKVLVQYTSNYPLSCFRFIVTTPLYHPRVNIRNGRVRLSIIPKWDLTVPDTRFYYTESNRWAPPYSILDLAKELDNMFSDFSYETAKVDGCFVPDWIQSGFETNIQNAQEMARKLTKGYSLFYNYKWSPEAHVVLPLEFRKQIFSLLVALRHLDIHLPNEIKFLICQKLCKSFFGKSDPWDRFFVVLGNK